MFEKKKILGLIPARGGSKGVKDKNIIDLCGRPLISYTIEAANKSRYIDNVVVSTDSEKIAKVAKAAGAEVPFLRPAELASDTSKTIDSVLHAINTLGGMGQKFDVVVLLQPTQPLRTAEDIDAAIEYYFSSGERDLVSVSEVDDHPILMRRFGEDGQMYHLLEGSSTCRRQDMDCYYRVNGCIYINQILRLNDKTSFNDNELGFIMPREKAVDIDEMKDLYIAEYYLKNREE